MQTLADPLQTPATLLHPSRTLSELIESYLTRLADGKSPHTLDCYRRDFGLLLAFAVAPEELLEGGHGMDLRPAGLGASPASPHLTSDW